MKLGARLLVGMVGAIVVAGTVAPSRALAAKCPVIEQTASECKALGCEKNAVTALAMCAELPFTKSCQGAAELQRRQCHKYCDETFPKARDPQAGSCRKD
jgi:hypothetical protein